MWQLKILIWAKKIKNSLGSTKYGSVCCLIRLHNVKFHFLSVCKQHPSCLQIKNKRIKHHVYDEIKYTIRQCMEHFTSYTWWTCGMHQVCARMKYTIQQCMEHFTSSYTWWVCEMHQVCVRINTTFNNVWSTLLHHVLNE